MAFDLKSAAIGGVLAGAVASGVLAAAQPSPAPSVDLLDPAFQDSAAVRQMRDKSREMCGAYQALDQALERVHAARGAGVRSASKGHYTVVVSTSAGPLTAEFSIPAPAPDAAASPAP